VFPHLGLEIAEEVPKVYVENLASLCDHDVVVVPIANPQHVPEEVKTVTRVSLY